MEKNQSPVANFLKSENQSLGLLIAKISKLTEWNALMSEAIPEEKALLQNCQIVRYENQTLFVLTASASWVTRFKFYVEDLIVKLRQHADFQELKRIDYKVRPDGSKKLGSVKKRKEKLSAENQEILRKILQKIKS